LVVYRELVPEVGAQKNFIRVYVPGSRHLQCRIMIHGNSNRFRFAPGYEYDKSAHIDYKDIILSLLKPLSETIQVKALFKNHSSFSIMVLILILVTLPV
jgi:hypothetical protein